MADRLNLHGLFTLAPLWLLFALQRLGSTIVNMFGYAWAIYTLDIYIMLLRVRTCFCLHACLPLSTRLLNAAYYNRSVAALVDKPTVHCGILSGYIQYILLRYRTCITLVLPSYHDMQLRNNVVMRQVTVQLPHVHIQSNAARDWYIHTYNVLTIYNVCS